MKQGSSSPTQKNERKTISFNRAQTKKLSKLLSMDRFPNLPVPDSNSEFEDKYEAKLAQEELA